MFVNFKYINSKEAFRYSLKLNVKIASVENKMNNYGLIILFRLIKKDTIRIIRCYKFYSHTCWSKSIDIAIRVSQYKTRRPGAAFVRFGIKCHAFAFQLLLYFPDIIKLIKLLCILYPIPG